MARNYMIHKYYAVVWAYDGDFFWAYEEYLTLREARARYNTLVNYASVGRVEIVKRLKSKKSKEVAALETL